MLLAVLLKMRMQFAIIPLQQRICKYRSFFFLTLFNETHLGATACESIVEQLLVEVLKNLAANTAEQLLVQVQNAILRKAIEESPLYSARAFVRALAECNTETIAEKRVRLSVKYFEIAWERLIEVGSSDEITQVVELAQNAAIGWKRPPMGGTPIGEKVVAVLREWCERAVNRGVGAIETADLVVAIRPAGKIGDRKIIAPDVPKKGVKIRNLRVPR
jgi:hypothetical protein